LTGHDAAQDFAIKRQPGAAALWHLGVLMVGKEKAGQLRFEQ